MTHFIENDNGIVVKYKKKNKWMKWCAEICFKIF